MSKKTESQTGVSVDDLLGQAVRLNTYLSESAQGHDGQYDVVGGEDADLEDNEESQYGDEEEMASDLSDTRQDGAMAEAKDEKGEEEDDEDEEEDMSESVLESYPGDSFNDHEPFAVTEGDMDYMDDMDDMDYMDDMDDMDYMDDMDDMDYMDYMDDMEDEDDMDYMDDMDHMEMGEAKSAAAKRRARKRKRAIKKKKREMGPAAYKKQKRKERRRRKKNKSKRKRRQKRYRKSAKGKRAARQRKEGVDSLDRINDVLNEVGPEEPSQVDMRPRSQSLRLKPMGKSIEDMQHAYKLVQRIKDMVEDEEARESLDIFVEYCRDAVEEAWEGNIDEETMEIQSNEALSIAAQAASQI